MNISSSSSLPPLLLYNLFHVLALIRSLSFKSLTLNFPSYDAHKTLKHSVLPRLIIKKALCLPLHIQRLLM